MLPISNPLLSKLLACFDDCCWSVEAALLRSAVGLWVFREKDLPCQFCEPAAMNDERGNKDARTFTSRQP